MEEIKYFKISNAYQNKPFRFTFLHKKYKYRVYISFIYKLKRTVLKYIFIWNTLLKRIS